MANQSLNSNLTHGARIWQGWCDFWFRPGDPSTLGLMRILAGIFIVYTHLAYSNDLQEFFGKDAFVDLNLAEQMRKDFPVFAPSYEWEEQPNNIYLPLEPPVRRAFLEWMSRLPYEKNARAQVLAYLDNLPIDPNNPEGRAGLAFAQNLLIQPSDERVQGLDYDAFIATPPGERNKILDVLVEMPAGKDRELVPKFFHPSASTDPNQIERQHKDREQVRRRLERLLATMPPEPGKISRIFAHFSYQALVGLRQRKHSDPLTEFNRTLNYLRERLPDDPKEREKTIVYLDRWGVDPERTFARGQYTWSIWFHVTDPTAMATIHAIFIVFMIMFTLGLFTRVTSVLTWIAALCYIHRSQQVLFGMDTMMNINMIYLMIGPSGATFSLDRWLAKRRAQRILSGEVRGDPVAAQAILNGPAPSVAANFATRLLQVHFCFIYAASGLAKLKGGTWWSGNAMWLTIANPEFSPVVFAPYRWVLDFLCEHRLLWEILMSGGVVFTLVLEIGLPFLVWSRRLRPYVLVGAIFLHTGIATFMGLTVFSMFMMILLMAYIPPEVVRRWVDTGGRLFEWPRKGLATEKSDKAAK